MILRPRYRYNTHEKYAQEFYTVSSFSLFHVHNKNILWVFLWITEVIQTGAQQICFPDEPTKDILTNNDHDNGINNIIIKWSLIFVVLEMACKV